MEFQFELPWGLQKSDWKAFYHVYYRINPAVRFWLLFLRTATGVLGIFMFLAVVGVLVSEDSSPAAAIVPILFCLLFLSYTVGFRPLTVWLSKKNQLAANERMVVTIHEAGVTDQTGVITTHYEYQAFYAICYYRDIYMLFLNRKTALLLPERCRAGGSSPELKRFLEEKTGKTIRYIK